MSFGGKLLIFISDDLEPYQAVSTLVRDVITLDNLQPSNSKV